MILGVSISSLSTYFIINNLDTIPRGMIAMLVIVFAGGFFGGYVSKDMKASFPIRTVSRYLCGFEHTQKLERFVLFGLVAGAVGVAATSMERKHTSAKKELRPKRSEEEKMMVE